MLPERATDDNATLELQLLRSEYALLTELVNVDRTLLRNFMAVAAQTLTRVRTVLQQRSREPALFRRKLARLRKLYALLHQRAVALSMPSLTQLLDTTLKSLHTPDGLTHTGDELLPTLEHIDAVFLALTTIAKCTGIPLIARRATRPKDSASHRPAVASQLGASSHTALGTGVGPQLALALQQLCKRLATESGKRVKLTVHGLEQAPENHAGALYDMLCQLLRNALEHGIELPAARAAAGKSARGSVSVEFLTRHPGQAELVFQDDGQGLNGERIVTAAVTQGLIAPDATSALDPRQATKFIFHAGLSTAPEPIGRGMGLRIVRDHAKRLDGQIQVATKHGQFTRFRIKMPLTTAATETPASAVAAARQT